MAGSGFQISLEMLEKFQGALEGVLADLVGEDPGANAAEHGIGATDLGVSFAEAPMIGGVIQETATRLRALIATLHDQITAMKLSIKVNGANTADVDDDTRRALNEIMARIGQGGQKPVTTGSTTKPGGRVDLE
ncbi:hypothetical protein [Embleya hyalina]|uniref:Uncharacterized protein n=1 Tax=Embleya hyalina TaxID=516124 RepID=A0A401YP73_9ACTN|nr:hypothetical protein [Embleya hyalina]GCD96365.1 hypothetical protein EHYA_04050 [Embleya hyalina]